MDQFLLNCSRMHGQAASQWQPIMLRPWQLPWHVPLLCSLLMLSAVSGRCKRITISRPHSLLIRAGSCAPMQVEDNFECDRENPSHCWHSQGARHAHADIPQGSPPLPCPCFPGLASQNSTSAGNWWPHLYFWELELTTSRRPVMRPLSLQPPVGAWGSRILTSLVSWCGPCICLPCCAHVMATCFNKVREHGCIQVAAEVCLLFSITQRTS